MARRLLGATLRAWGRLVGIGLCVGAACSALAAPSLEPKARDELLQQHGGWVERAKALREVARPGPGGARLRGLRAQCWGIGAALTETLSKDITSNQKALEESFIQLQAALALPEVPAGADAPPAVEKEKEEESPEQKRTALLQKLETLERQQLMLESAVLQPSPATPVLVSEVIRGDARRAACRRWMKGWNDELARAANHQWSVPALTAQLDERIRWDFLDRAVDGDVFSSNNSGLPSVMTDEAGMTERLGGTDALAASLVWALGSMDETTGPRGIITINPNFASWKHPPSTARDTYKLWWPLIRLQLPLSTTLADDPAPAEGEPTGRLRRYGLTLGYDFGDFGRDPRHSKRLECVSAVEALLPWLGLPAQGRISSLAARRRPLYARCVEEGADTLRIGVRGSLQLQTVDAPRGDTTRAGPLALGLIVEPNRYLAGQLTVRQVFWPHSQEYVLSAHLGTGLPRPAFGTDSLLRLGVDASLTFSDREEEDARTQWLIAPSLLVRLTPYLFATASIGYLNGFSESGVMTNLGLTLDADPALTYRALPPSR